MSDLAESTSLSDPPRVASDPGPALPEVAQLTAALAGRDSFIGVLGHELRNSVSPMLLLAEQLRAMAGEPGAPPALASRVAMLTRNLGKLVTTIDRVAEVAELRRGTVQLALVPVNLAEVITEVCQEMNREASAGGVTLVCDAIVPVHGTWDRARIKQIIENLVSNAIRYGGGGQVELSSVDRGTAGELIVRDHGPGLEPAVLAHLFDPFGPFGPLDPERARRTGGFGIGLWVVKTLCSAMQGSVTGENDPSGGARFCVVLPRG
ncbi:MAG: HAMP domain-containing sensor histidine kinase [Kofleriaceae bacterium]